MRCVCSGTWSSENGVDCPIVGSYHRRRTTSERSKLDLRQYVRAIPDFPSPGILFRDITPLLSEPDAFRYAVDALAERFEAVSVDVVVAVESRGFLFAAPFAYRQGVPLVPVRKEGKLPFDTHSASYALEYGMDALEVHVDAIGEGQRVLIIDDLLATGGTVAATVRLIGETGGIVAGVGVVIELLDLPGRESIRDLVVESLISY